VDLLARNDALDPDTELENNDVKLLVAGSEQRIKRQTEFRF
jgi:hypothetical protein